MNQIDRLIAKARKLGFRDGDVFLICGDSGVWKIDNKEFPDMASAERYIDALSADSDGDCVVIINDITPEYLKDLKARIRDSDRKKYRDEKRREQEMERERRQQEERKQQQEERREKKFREQKLAEKEDFTGNLI